MKAKGTWKWKVGLGYLFRKYRMWFECPCDRGILFRLFFYTADMVLGSICWTRGGRTEMKSQESAVSQRAKPTMSNCGGKVHGYCFWAAFGRCCVDKKPLAHPGVWIKCTRAYIYYINIHMHVRTKSINAYCLQSHVVPFRGLLCILCWMWPLCVCNSKGSCVLWQPLCSKATRHVFGKSCGRLQH